MMLWPNRLVAMLKRLGFWRLVALLAALLLLIFALGGPRDPSVLHMRWR